jgi:hypothetical protein
MGKHFDEAQAEDRYHRLGQRNPVEVVRLVLAIALRKILAMAGQGDGRETYKYASGDVYESIKTDHRLMNNPPQ